VLSDKGRAGIQEFPHGIGITHQDSGDDVDFGAHPDQMIRKLAMSNEQSAHERREIPRQSGIEQTSVLLNDFDDFPGICCRHCLVQ
jgi:hypothetical protein